jgi:hypothetical protein
LTPAGSTESMSETGMAPVTVAMIVTRRERPELTYGKGTRISHPSHHSIAMKLGDGA